jgi:hypothetical protein
VGAKVKEMESADDNTVTDLATCLSLFLNFISIGLLIVYFSALMDVGSNVLQAASKTVSKDKESDPGAIIEVRRNIVDLPIRFELFI